MSTFSLKFDHGAITGMYIRCTDAYLHELPAAEGMEDEIDKYAATVGSVTIQPANLAQRESFGGPNGWIKHAGAFEIRQNIEYNFLETPKDSMAYFYGRLLPRVPSVKGMRMSLRQRGMLCKHNLYFEDDAPQVLHIEKLTLYNLEPWRCSDKFSMRYAVDVTVDRIFLEMDADSLEPVSLFDIVRPFCEANQERGKPKPVVYLSLDGELSAKGFKNLQDKVDIMVGSLGLDEDAANLWWNPVFKPFSTYPDPEDRSVFFPEGLPSSDTGGMPAKKKQRRT